MVNLLLGDTGRDEIRSSVCTMLPWLPTEWRCLFYSPIFGQSSGRKCNLSKKYCTPLCNTLPSVLLLADATELAIQESNAIFFSLTLFSFLASSLSSHLFLKCYTAYMLILWSSVGQKLKPCNQFSEPLRLRSVRLFISNLMTLSKVGSCSSSMKHQES